MPIILHCHRRFVAVILAIAVLPLLVSNPPLGHAAAGAQPGDSPGISAEEAAIRAVITRTNAQQEAAIATEDSSVMRDTATERYFREMERLNDALLDGGVMGVELIELEWGAIHIEGLTAEATTYETWAITTRRGRVLEPPARNIYRLVLEDGVWKVDANEHPDLPPLPPGRPAQT
jgi:hypothetical protein